MPTATETFQAKIHGIILNAQNEIVRLTDPSIPPLPTPAPAPVPSPGIPPVPSPAPVPAPPPPAPTPVTEFIPLSKNKVFNHDFKQGLVGWTKWTGNWSMDGPRLKLDNTFAHFGQSIEGISPGDRIRYECVLQTGNKVADSWDDGGGLFSDFRVISQDPALRDAIVQTLNGPASTSGKRVRIRVELIVPDYARPRYDVPKSQWSIVALDTGLAETSGTSGQGCNFGRINNSDNGLNDPLILPFYYSKLGTSSSDWNCDAAAAAANKCNHPLPNAMKFIVGGHNWFATMSAVWFEYFLVSIDKKGTF